MSKFEPWYAARDLMVEALREDLIGDDSHVGIDEPPLDRYAVGVLRPVDSGPIDDIFGESSLDDANEGAEADFDPGVNLAHLRYPSSMGLTAFAELSSGGEVRILSSADHYVQESDEGLHTQSKDAGVSWLRHRVVGEAQVILIDSPGTFTMRLADGLELRVIVRKAVAGLVAITAVLVNTFRDTAGERSDAYCWFRPRIELELAGSRLTGRRPDQNANYVPEDIASEDLLYRDIVSPAVGHGSAVEWDVEAPVVTAVNTTYLPRVEVPSVLSERDDVGALSMSALSVEGGFHELHHLVDAYEEWIDGQEREVSGMSVRHARTAEEHLVTARQAAKRMRRGLEILDENDQVATAFAAMNSAMNEQRSRQDLGRTGATSPASVDHSWRPFQIAFVLMNIEGVIDADSPDRKIADVLWFPTGGGKTEAYLALIAIAALLRRLRDPLDGGGVCVIMRYTLRLLTSQQFERAAGLICALEVWRRRELPQAAPVTIGLWVGESSTPNNVADAKRALDRIRRGDLDDSQGDPRQLLKCPWCASSLTVDDYDADVKRDRLTVFCPSADCEFASGLPVNVTDSDVYNARPTLVVGTVDKFAMLAWNSHAGSLLGADGDTKPPSLIIQDELHLISGPLGTMVGLYETAIDAACAREAIPKVVASTATIRSAPQQVRAVFARDAVQFPPPVIDHHDSFFAVTAPRNIRPTRMYVGLVAPGASHSTLMLRTYAVLLQRAASMQVTDEVRDAYWTLLGYFSSLRVLGGAYIQTVDDVPDRMGLVAAREGSDIRTIREPRELTSRQKSSEIPQELAALSTPFGSPESPDVVLATNMISVGVDVDRLGLMAVMGQPQTTAEYIQATSRVGRRHPGLIVTIFNAARSRDLSHFESFTSYHRALYRQVEPVAATPFAPRAVDRGLHGMFVALSRLIVPGASSDTAVAPPVNESEFERVREAIRSRVLEVDPDEVSRVEDALNELADYWRDAVSNSVVKKYAGWRDAASALLTPAGGMPGRSSAVEPATFPVEGPPWPTLTSLRNVDAESSLFIARRRVSRGPTSR